MCQIVWETDIQPLMVIFFVCLDYQYIKLTYNNNTIVMYYALKYITIFRLVFTILTTRGD